MRVGVGEARLVLGKQRHETAVGDHEVLVAVFSL
jgi:hypothetical protein